MNHLFNCLYTMAERLTHLLPVCPTGVVCARPLPVTLVDGQYVVTLPELPEFNTLTLYSANGSVITLGETDGPSINYVTSHITFPTDGSTESSAESFGEALEPLTRSLAEVPGPHVVVDYQISLAETFIEQAVADLSRRLPRKQTTQLITRDTGVTPLPPGLTRILSLCRVDCGCTARLSLRAEPQAEVSPQACQETSCPALCGEAPCFQCHHCATYIDAGNLIQAAGPCLSELFDLCYLAGYTLDKYGCYTGRTPDLADLVMYLAQSLAYRNPQMLMAIAGVPFGPSINSNNNNSSSSGSTGSGNSATSETTTTIKTKDNCGKEEKTVTTKTGSGSSSKYSSSTASAISSLFSSKTNSGLADQYELLYLAGLDRRTHIAALRITNPRSGYKARFAARC